MLDNSEKIYNKKALDKVKTPDDLHDYLKVSNPSVWILLVAVVLLLVGALVWGIFGKLYITISVPTYVENGKAISLVGESRINSVAEGMPITVNSNNGYVASKANTNQKISEIASLYGLGNIQETPTDTAYVVISNIDTGNGLYNAEIAIEEVQPISFLFR